MSTPLAVRRARRVVVVLLAATLLTQRLALPLGADQLPLSLPLVLGVLVIGVASGALRIDLAGLRLYALAMGAVVVSTLVVLALGSSPSLMSLVFLLAIYTVAVVRSPVAPGLLADTTHRAYLGIMTGAAVVSLGQVVIQYLGVPYQDYLLRIVPPEFVQQGYATGDPLMYGSDLHRTNAVLFLEPSFLGYFLGIAVVMALARHCSAWRVCLLVAGAVPSLAGNAIVVVLAGVAVLAAGPLRRRLRGLVPVLAVVLVVAVATPLGDLYFERSTEISGEDNSTTLRLVDPYEILLPAWWSTPESVLVGSGAGAATEVINTTTEQAVTTPVIPKLLVEYGILGAVPVLLFLGWALVGNPRTRPWSPGLLIGFFVVNAALLQVTFAVGTILLARLVPGVPRPGAPPPVPDDPGDGGAAAPGDQAHLTAGARG
ncbi:hypothetical protein [Blastococcus sp. TF02A-26]|uniref:hypothetical protein n=1 Tax=Blastococcus sp. TF02A-26 TaxID=2250577 RepID=UPI000DEA8194|nr:hypothetical protein [Blastococcus sp. TF02A-26]RBY87386.1 hypothetical protein DQ240_07285 [Blastococcus sp. TF02A-26]